MTWNSAEHPRGPNGQFIDKDGLPGNVKISPGRSVAVPIPGTKPAPRISHGKVSVRLTTNSISGSYGYDIKLGSNYNLHLAALARIEKTSAKKNYLQKLQTKALMNLAGYLPSNKLQNYAQDIIQKRSTRAGGARVAIGNRRTNPPSVRVSSGGSRNISGNKVNGNPGVRSPNRKARTRSLQGQKVKG